MYSNFVVVVTGCNIAGIDLVIVLDVSFSIHANKAVRPLLEFTRRIIQRLDIGLDSSLVGVAFFASNASFHFGLNQHTSRQALLSAIDELSGSYPSKRGTNFVPVLNLLNETNDDPTLGFRPGYPDVAVIVTDGRSSDEDEMLEQAIEEFKMLDIYQLYAVGVGAANLKQLERLTGDRTTAFFASQLDDTTLVQVAQKLTERLCSRSKLNVSKI